MSKCIAMIPARLGSQRLRQKNLQQLGGIPLITRAIRKSVAAGVFDEVWVNSESEVFREIAENEGVGFHKRPEELGSNSATSEEFVLEFLKAHECDYLIQVHSIAPLLSVDSIRSFVQVLSDGQYDVLLSCVNEQIECAIDGVPINFTFDRKQNSQDLRPIQRIIWSITGWRKDSYLKASKTALCSTYAGRVGFYPLDSLAGHVIKTQRDLDLAQALLTYVGEPTYLGSESIEK